MKTSRQVASGRGPVIAGLFGWGVLICFTAFGNSVLLAPILGLFPAPFRLLEQDIMLRWVWIAVGAGVYLLLGTWTFIKGSRATGFAFVSLLVLAVLRCYIEFCVAVDTR